MSKKDTLTKQYLGQNKVFADAFNYYLFHGRQVIKPEDLKEQDPSEIAIIRKLGQVFPNQKFRDVLKHCLVRYNKSATFVLLGIESQSDVHYAMPVKDYLYDALNYAAQVEEIRKKHMAERDLHESATFLSGFTGNDTILPVITLCICFDKAKWDAPRSLYEMFGTVDPWVKKYVDNYKLNLITPDEIKDFSKFSSELGIVLECIQNSDDNHRLHAIMESNKQYRSVDVDTIELINTFTSTNISTKEAEGGKVDMCKAIEDMIEEGRNEGRNEIIDEIKKMSADGLSLDQIITKIEQKNNRKARTRKKQPKS